jgi:hypothetical protein
LEARFAARVTRDVDVVIAADQFSAGRLPERLPAAGELSGKLAETWITVDVLPEGERPGTASGLAPTTIPSPAAMGGIPAALRYILLPSLVELKLAASRSKEHFDVIELLRANPDRAQ